MVSVRIVSRYQEGFLGEEDPRGIVADGPLYPDALTLITKCGAARLIPWTRKCAEDIQKMALEADELFDLINNILNKGRYLGSEWCQQQPSGPWAACDAYSLRCREWSPVAHREIEMEYYLKFAIGVTGAILLLASCHPST
jgi:hypothetical protein